MRMPVLQTDRLIIRPFETSDLSACDHLFRDVWGHPAQPEWMEWASRNPDELAQLYQPPYGDRALILRETDELIGTTGLVPSFGPFGLINHENDQKNAPPVRNTPEIGLLWAVATPHRGKGYAAEAARALAAYAFGPLNLARLVATTEYDNAASQAVMRRLGMDVWHNSHQTPPWFQVVGLLLNCAA